MVLHQQCQATSLCMEMEAPTLDKLMPPSTLLGLRVNLEQLPIHSIIELTLGNQVFLRHLIDLEVEVTLHKRKILLKDLTHRCKITWELEKLLTRSRALPLSKTTS